MGEGSDVGKAPEVLVSRGGTVGPPPGVQVGVCGSTTYSVRELRRSLAWARLARFDSFFLPDHWQDFIPQVLWDPSLTWRARLADSPHSLREVFTLLGALARSAGRVRLGLAVTEMLRRHPVMVAQAALTLSEMAARPLILGVGAGERLNTEPYGLALPKPVARFEEALQVIRLSFDSTGAINFHGEHFKLDGAVMGLAPPESRTPEIWVAAHGPRMLEITGRYGDGWIPTAPPLHGPADYEIAWKAIQATAEGAGRSPQTITPSLLAYAVMAPNVTQVERLLRSKLARYMALMGTSAEWWDRWGLDHPFGRDFGGYPDVLPEAIDRDFIHVAIDRVPPELVRSCSMSGTPRQVEATIRDYADAGLRHIVLVPASALISSRNQAYVAWALPRLVRALRR